MLRSNTEVISVASEYFLREAHDRVLSGESGTDLGLREEILASWDRSTNSGLRPELFAVPHIRDLETDGRLERAARPVFDQVEGDLSSTDVGLFLTNERAEILDRRADRGILEPFDRVQLAPGFRYAETDVGTNAIGTALTVQSPSIVFGCEHFADALGPLACAAIAIEDPATGKPLGVLDVSCNAGDANPLMLPFVRRVTREIEQRLLDATLVGERTLRERFLHVKRWAKIPIVSLSKDSMMTNRAAAALLHPSDQAQLWEWIQRGLIENHLESPLTLANGMSVTACFEPVTDGGEFVGAIVRLDTTEPSGNVEKDRCSSVRGRYRPTNGWASLTETERSVTELIAQGLTNREAATRMYLSHHTVEYHLRSVFRKMGIHSRVQLATLVMQRASESEVSGTLL